MKKRGFAIFLAAVLSLALTSCGCKKTDSNRNNTDTDAPAATDAADEAEATEYPTDDEGNLLGTKQDGAVDEVNMSKVDGEKLAETTPEDDSLSSSGEIDGVSVSIDDAKLIDYNGEQAVVVSFTFKNTTSNPLSFDGLFDSVAAENGVNFSPLAVTGVEGINVNSAVELIESGETATVQKTYAYSGEETMNITVQIYGRPADGTISKAFKLK